MWKKVVVGQLAGGKKGEGGGFFANLMIRLTGGGFSNYLSFIFLFLL